MKETSNKSYIGVMCLSVFCLIVIIVSVTYAYFTPKIVGDGKVVNVAAGKIGLEISESNITASNFAPIKDMNDDGTLNRTKVISGAEKNEFTISRKSGSNLNVCYSLFLEMDEFGSLLQDDKYSKFIKYSLEYQNAEETKNLDFDFSTYGSYTPNSDGKVRLPLLANQELNSTTTSRDYVLRIWLSYSDTEDQTPLFTSNGGDDTSRNFKARIVASGANGSCPAN